MGTGMLHDTVYASCPICYGSRAAFDGPCTTCADPDPAVARKVLGMLTPAQMRFLRAFEHTLAYQPVTESEYKAHPVEFYVEEDDGTFDEDLGRWLVPNSSIWFASGMSRMGPCGSASFIKYNPLGLLLRECLKVGADAGLRGGGEYLADAAKAGETVQ